jgi:hypothetical protein
MPTTTRRPQPSTSEAELAARLRLSVSRLARRLRRESVSDVTASQLSALYTIARLGPLTVVYALQQRQGPVRYRFPEEAVRIG